MYGASAVTALTAQNTKGVRAIHYPPPEIVAAQIEAVLEDFAVAAIKIGMLGSAGIAGAVAERLGFPSSVALRTTPSPAMGRPGGRPSFDGLSGEGAAPSSSTIR